MQKWKIEEQEEEEESEKNNVETEYIPSKRSDENVKCEI